ncbi:MAG: glycosyltransferase family 2 protein [Bacteroidales bacterium]|nr:glycosyltransferase family 2 protein [Bacteroidales bacterium]
MERDKVAVVILNWNGKKFLEQFLPSVVEYSSSENVSIWVADNGSTDDSVDFLTGKYPQIKQIILYKNYGFAGGYNKALQQINAEYFVLLNSDVEVTKNWIDPIIDYIEENDDVAAVQPKILAFHNKKQFEYAGAAGGFIDKFGYPFCRGRILDQFEEDNGQYNDIIDIFWATGACLFIRSQDFLENLFDEDFFAHMEEIDLCWRLKNKNRRIVYNYQSTVYHVGGGTLPKKSSNKLFLNYRNNLLLLYKNLPQKKTSKILFQRMILDGLSAMVYLAKFQFSYFVTVLKAHRKFYSMKQNFKAKRVDLLQFNNKSHSQIYKKSIVFDYFIRKKRNFTNIKF